MNNKGNAPIIIILIIILFFAGYLYYKANGAIGPRYSSYSSGYYAPNSRSTVSSYYSMPSSAYRAYSSSAPYVSQSSSTSYSTYTTPSYYSTTYTSSDPNQNCYISGYDQYGAAITTCQYMQE